MKSFSKKPAYKILKQDRDAHVVYSSAENIYSYVLLKPRKHLFLVNYYSVRIRPA